MLLTSKITLSLDSLIVAAMPKPPPKYLREDVEDDEEDELVRLACIDTCWNIFFFSPWERRYPVWLIGIDLECFSVAKCVSHNFFFT